MANDWQSNYNQNQQNQNLNQIKSQLNNINTQLIIQNINSNQKQYGGVDNVSPLLLYISLGLPLLILMVADVLTSGSNRDHEMISCIRSFYFSYIAFGFPLLALKKSVQLDTRKVLAKQLFLAGYVFLAVVALINMSFVIVPFMAIIFGLIHYKAISSVNADLARESLNRKIDKENAKKKAIDQETKIKSSQALTFTTQKLPHMAKAPEKTIPINKKTQQAMIEKARARNEKKSYQKQKTHEHKDVTITAKPLDLIGQPQAREALNKIIAIAKVNAARQAEGLKQLEINLHAVFSGSPGTGKTSFARHYAAQIKNLGLLRKGHVIEVSRKDLVSGYTGQTAIKTEAVVRSALGGVLFIDEAYSLKSNPDDAYGQESIDVLLKLIEDNKSDLVVILAGYDDKMRDFLISNPGFKSRMPNHVQFHDFSNEELALIFEKMCESRDLIIEKKDLEQAMESIVREKKARDFGNARTVRNVLEQIISKQTFRLSNEKKSHSKNDFQKILSSDIEAATSTSKSPMRKINQLIGLNSVKLEIEQLIAFLEITKLRKGKVDLGSTNLHMVFAGQPGTGKTTVARMMGEIYRDLGILPSGHVIEVDRSDLVAGFVGQTAIKTKEVVESAFGGVLFIDEAYSLVQGPTDSFGQECMDTLVKCIEDNRDKFVLVAAGYRDEMHSFIKSNPGFNSRISKTLVFENYDSSELLSIFKDLALKENIQLADGSESVLLGIFNETREENDFGNARSVRQLFENILKEQSVRLFNERKSGTIEAALV